MKYGLIGQKLGHSFSKEIHESLANYQYELKELEKDQLDLFLKEKNFNAVNVTIPYKETVIKYLDELDISAKNVKAVNTIVNKDGKLIGYNTDYMGLLTSINKANIIIKNKKVLIIGSGGASLACEAVAKTLESKEIIKCNRNKKDGVISFDELDNYLDIEVIFNATPVGMYPNNDESFDFISKFKKLESYIDCIYNPLQTKMSLMLQKQNVKTIGGLYMLVAQAYYAVEIFLNQKLNLKLMDKTYRKIVKTKDNVILIGMPSSGKTKIAGILKHYLNKEVIDLDVKLEEEVGMSIKDYIEQFGEESFRNKESLIVEKYAKLNNQIISTGGGVILNYHNIELLKQNGKIYFINRKLELLTPTISRPLSNNTESLTKLYNERIDKYMDYADYIIDNNTNIDEAVKHILEVREHEIINY